EPQSGLKPSVCGGSRRASIRIPFIDAADGARAVEAGIGDKPVAGGQAGSGAHARDQSNTQEGVAWLARADEVKLELLVHAFLDDDRLAIVFAPVADLLVETDLAYFLALPGIRR